MRQLKHHEQKLLKKVTPLSLSLSLRVEEDAHQSLSKCLDRLYPMEVGRGTTRGESHEEVPRAEPRRLPHVQQAVRPSPSPVAPLVAPPRRRPVPDKVRGLVAVETVRLGTRRPRRKDERH